MQVVYLVNSEAGMCKARSEGTLACQSSQVGKVICFNITTGIVRPEFRAFCCERLSLRHVSRDASDLRETTSNIEVDDPRLPMISIPPRASCTPWVQAAQRFCLEISWHSGVIHAQTM